MGDLRDLIGHARQPLRSGGQRGEQRGTQAQRQAASDKTLHGAFR
jgi:hypothetical protein